MYILRLLSRERNESNKLIYPQLSRLIAQLAKKSWAWAPPELFPFLNLQGYVKLENRKSFDARPSCQRIVSFRPFHSQDLNINSPYWLPYISLYQLCEFDGISGQNNPGDKFVYSRHQSKWIEVVRRKFISITFSSERVKVSLSQKWFFLEF